jgi:hypothetical protein
VVEISAECLIVRDAVAVDWHQPNAAGALQDQMYALPRDAQLVTDLGQR